MYHGKYKAQHLQHRRKRRSKKTVMLFLSLLLVATMVVGGTLAYLFTNTEPVENIFTPSYVSCSVTEEFNGTTKRNVNVTNTGNIDAYIRVTLVTYRVNEDGQHIGGTAAIPTFTPGAGWVKYGEYYYYTLPVAASGTPNSPLIDETGIKLTGSYDDADGGKQVIEVMAEAIQSVPDTAVKDAWGTGFSIDANGKLIVPSN